MAQSSAPPTVGKITYMNTYRDIPVGSISDEYAFMMQVAMGF